ncbi:MAG TPA: glycosyltransferase family 2 protein [Herpetosiphonaceae bacterium]
MSSRLPHVALIVVAYGHAAQLPATLDALRQLAYPADRRSIVVVENGDGSSAAVARRQPDVCVLEPGRNLGFAGGCNLAVAQTESEIVALINPDLQPQPAFLRALIAPLADSTIGVVGAKLLYPDGRTIQHAGGYLQQPVLLAQHVGYGEADRGQHDTPGEVEFVTGAALAMRRATWEALGGLDEAFYPAYYEDVDLCWRVRQQGSRVWYAPDAVAIHQEAAALGKGSAAYHRLYHHNRLRLLFKHYADDWLVQSWLPAELTHLRATADDAEIAGLLAAYLSWQSALLAGSDAPAASPAEIPPAEPLHQGELDWTVRQVSAKRTIAPLPFRSRWPLVAALRTWWNRIATETYLRPLIQQQNDYNASLAELARALERQRRAADAAIVCQGMVLAKVLGTKNKEQRTKV